MPDLYAYVDENKTTVRVSLQNLVDHFIRDENVNEYLQATNVRDCPPFSAASIARGAPVAFAVFVQTAFMKQSLLSSHPGIERGLDPAYMSSSQ